MAKASPQEQKEELDYLKQQKAAYENAQKVIQQYNKANQQTKVELQGQLMASRKIIQSFIEQFKSLKDFNQLLEKTGTSYEKLADVTEKYGKSLDDLLTPSEELLDLQNSILNTQGKQSGEYDVITKKIAGQTTQLKSIADILGDASDISEHQKNIVLEAAEAYKSQDASIGSLRKELKRGNITQEQFNDGVISLSNYWDDIVNKIDTTNPKLETLYEILKAMNSEAAAFNLAQANQSNAKIGAIKDVGNVVGSTLGDPAGAISSGTNIAAGAYGKDKSMQAAGIVGLIIGALGVAKGLTNFYQELNKATYEAKKLIPQLEENINNINISLGRATSNSRNFVQELALLDFGGQLRQAGAEFEAASKTAFFGGQLKGIKGNTQLLQLAGFSAERIAGAMKNLSAIAGLNNNNDLAKNFAILSQNMGLSEDAAAGIVSSFKLLDGVGAAGATDNLKSFRYQAEAAGINVGTASENLADAAKDALKYQIRSSKELGRQVMFASKLGVTLKSIAEAGRQSVLDYEGQIAAERELEAYIGERVDLSGYRQLMARGDTPGAIELLQGMDALNPLKNDRLKLPQAQEALTDMLKMPLDEIQKIFSPGYVEKTAVGAKKELSLTDLNNQYLQTFKDAMSTLKVVSATIDAEQAILRAPIETGLKMAETVDVFNVAKRAQVANLETLQTLENAVAIAKDIANPNATDKALLAEREKQLSSYIKANPGVSLQAAGVPTATPYPFVQPGLSNTSFFKREPIKTAPLTSFNEAKFLQDEKLRNSVDNLAKKLDNFGNTASKTEVIIRDESGKKLYEKQLKYTEQKKGMVRQNVGRLGFSNDDFRK
jgi:hypothetical protein